MLQSLLEEIVVGSLYRPKKGNVKTSQHLEPKLTSPDRVKDPRRPPSRPRKGPLPLPRTATTGSTIMVVFLFIFLLYVLLPQVRDRSRLPRSPRHAGHEDDPRKGPRELR